VKELALHILDIASNSVRAKGKQIVITVHEDSINNQFIFKIEDDGTGIAPNLLNSIENPFTTSRKTRKVGLGIPLLSENCRLCNGNLTIHSTVGKGTQVTASFEYNHIDRPPLGDMGSTMSLFITSHPSINIIYTHKVNKASFKVSTEALKAELEEVPLTDLSVIQWLTEYIRENIEYLYSENSMSS